MQFIQEICISYDKKVCKKSENLVVFFNKMYRFACPRLTKNSKNENKTYSNNGHFFDDGQHWICSKKEDSNQHHQW